MHKNPVKSVNIFNAAYIIPLFLFSTARYNM